MAEERGGRPYPPGGRRPASWTKLFGTFLVALDPFKLLVAAAGILVTALGWWLISVVFYNAWTVPEPERHTDDGRTRRADPRTRGEPSARHWAKASTPGRSTPGP